MAAGAEESDQETAKSGPEIRTLLEAGQATGSFPKELVIRLSADLATAAPLDAKERKEGEARGIDYDKRLSETWEFTSTHVHRVVIETKDKRPVYRRIESRPFNPENLCQELFEGKIIEVEAQEGTGESIHFAGTHFNTGDRSIEIFHNETRVLEVGETCLFAGLRESDARAFAALYERLAKQARALFAAGPAPKKKLKSAQLSDGMKLQNKPRPPKSIPLRVEKPFLNSVGLLPFHDRALRIGSAPFDVQSTKKE